MAKIYGNPITLGGGGGQNADLPPLLDNFQATYGDTENTVILSAKKMKESRAKELAGAVWVYGDHEPENVNDGTKIQLTREEVVTSDGGEAQTVTKTVEWNNEADFFARQFTYNAKKQYQTMLEGATANVAYSEFPEEPTDYLNCAEILNSTEYEIPEDGWFKIIAVAKSGNGGGGRRYITGGRTYYDIGSSGGSGSIAVSVFALNKGTKIPINIEPDISISINEETMNARRGGDGIKGSTPAVSGGSKGIASGGNIENINGYDGNRGLSKISESSSSLTVNGVTTAYGEYTTTSGNGTQFSNGNTGTNAYVVILRGNTNIPSPAQASTLSLIPHDGEVDVNWTNSGDPVQNGTTLVYNNDHIPESPTDGVAVDVPLAQPATLASISDSKELQEDSKKQSYTITGVPNDKPVFVALFPYDKDRKYGLAKQEVEIPREHSWYDKQQELEAEVETVKAEMSDYQEYYVTTQEVLK